MPEAATAVSAPASAPVPPPVVATGAPPIEPTAAAPALDTTTSAAAPISTSPETAKVEAKERESARFASLAKKEAALVAEKRVMKAQAAELAKAREQVEAYEKARQGAKLDPLGALEQLGLNYEELTNYILNNKQPTPDLHVKALRDELQQFKAQQEQERVQATEMAKQRSQAEMERIVESARSAMVTEIKSSDKYELLNLLDLHGEVWKVVERKFETDNKLLTTAEAADAVQSELLEMLEKAYKSKLWQSRITPASEGEAKPVVSEPAKQRTLTNDLSASPATKSKPAISDDERMARAKAAFLAAQGKK